MHLIKPISSILWSYSSLPSSPGIIFLFEKQLIIRNQRCLIYKIISQIRVCQMQVCKCLLFFFPSFSLSLSLSPLGWFLSCNQRQNKIVPPFPLLPPLPLPFLILPPLPDSSSATAAPPPELYPKGGRVILSASSKSFIKSQLPLRCPPDTGGGPQGSRQGERAGGRAEWEGDAGGSPSAECQQTVNGLILYKKVKTDLWFLMLMKVSHIV